MSNLRSDVRAAIKSGKIEDSLCRAYLEGLCQQVDSLEHWLCEANRRLAWVRFHLERAVVTDGIDKGVVMLSQEGVTEVQVVNGRPCNVYTHENISELGDCLIAAYGIAGGVWQYDGELTPLPPKKEVTHAS